ncbi:MAG: hypothetical protein ACJ76Y_11565 [Thermoanaerobaculia bacterium]
MKVRPTHVMALAFTILIAFACVPPQTLLRHVAEYRFGPEQFTTVTGGPLGSGGIVVYTKSFSVPSDQRTLFVTLSTTGDGHGGAVHWYTATVNGRVCNQGDDGASGAPAGWIPLQKAADDADLHDNSIYYTWCCHDNVKPGAVNTVEIKLASSIPSQPVWMERSHFYIDSVSTNLCTPAGPVPASEERMAIPKSHQPHTHDQKPPQ